MASRKSKKNDMTLIVVLLLLLLLVGWLVWKWTSGSSKTTQPTSYSGAPAYNAPSPSPVTYSPVSTAALPPLPEVRYIAATPPPAQPSQPIQQTQPPPQTTQPPARLSTPELSDSTPPPVRSSPGKKNSTASSTTSKTTPKATTSTGTRELRPPTRPTRPAFADTPVTGAPIDGDAVVRGKNQDAAGRLLLYCTSLKTNLTYTYEVDAVTFNEANPGLMYNSAKVAKWKFVSSQ